MNLEAFLLDALDNIGQFDFNFAIRLLLFALGVIWIFTTYWVWKDSEERIENTIVRVFIVLLVLPFNFIGLIAYLLSRPKDTFESAYWGDLEKRYLQYETSDMGDCENCGYDLRPGFIYCPVCSHPVKAQCQECGEMIDRYWNFCPFCSSQQREFVVEEIQEEVPEVEEDILVDYEEERIRNLSVDQSRVVPEVEEPEVTNEPQPEFGLDDIEKKPEVQKARPEKDVIGYVRPPWRDVTPEEEEAPEKPGISIPTELGKMVITSASAFGKRINDLFKGVVEKVRSFAEMEIEDDLEKADVKEDLVVVEQNEDIPEEEVLEEPVLEKIDDTTSTEEQENGQNINNNNVSKKKKKKNRKRNKKKSRK